MDYTKKSKLCLQCKKESQGPLNFIKLVISKSKVFCQHVGKGRLLITDLNVEI